MRGFCLLPEQSAQECYDNHVKKSISRLGSRNDRKRVTVWMSLAGMKQIKRGRYETGFKYFGN